MSVTVPRLVLTACLLSPSMAWALGLGEIHLSSSLNEPMNAEIDLIAASPDELTALRASLAGRDAFTRYGIDRPPFLNSLTFKVGKSKEGRDVLQVRSQEAIPEPFVTFLVEVNWARGRLMREYTVLLDPPVYTPGERASSAAPVTAATTGNGDTSRRAAPATPTSQDAAAPAAGNGNRVARSAAPAAAAAAPGGLSGSNYRVAEGDTLAKIARSLHSKAPADVDQTMIAIYRANPEAFGGNINILKRGAVLRVPGADDIAALNQSEAMGEVHRQMNAWHEGGAAAPSGHLRLVTPGAGGSATGSGSGSGATVGSASSAEAQALKDRVKDLETQLAESHRLLDIRSNEMAALQRKLGGAATPNVATTTTPAPGMAPVATTKPAPAPAAPPPSAAVAPPPVAVEKPAPAASTATPPPGDNAVPVPVPVPAPTPANKPASPPVAESGSWLDWVAANWWLPAAILLALIAGLAVNAWRRRRNSGGDLSGFDSTGLNDFTDPKAGGDPSSFVVEESGEHPKVPESGAAGTAEHFGEVTADLSGVDATLSSESSVNLDQGDPLAEADFHMAYGLYDQAADLVRIALEREPGRRDLRLKLLEIYFVWGNKEQFLQTAKQLESTRDQSPAGEWDKIVIMGKQIAPDDPMFAGNVGGGRGAGALVDLNLEGGENRVDIDLFGEPDDVDQGHARVSDETSNTSSLPRLDTGSDLDFMLDAPERGADESPTREMPRRDEPTVESELMRFSDAPTQESPALRKEDRADRTAEVSLDDLGLDLDSLESTNDVSINVPADEEVEHPADAPTMVAGLDEKSRRLMAEAESRSKDKDLTALERELEASFVADLDALDGGAKTMVIGPESASTVQMPRGNEYETASTSLNKSLEFSDVHEAGHLDVDSTSKLRGINADSIDLDLDRLASALGSTDTVQQPRDEGDVFSSEVFDEEGHASGVEFDVGDALSGSDGATNKMTAISTQDMDGDDLPLQELEPVTMSEVGTKLDLARAYMDMGDPEGARSILEEVVSEGSASQKQEAQRLIEALPG
jgi:pilus assembly protein FimV